MKRLMLTTLIVSVLACAQEEMPAVYENAAFEHWGKLNEAQRKEMAILFLNNLHTVKKESGAESKPNFVTSCGLAFVAYWISNKIAQRLPGCFKKVPVLIQREWTVPTAGGIFVIAGTTILAATKGAEFVTGLWNGSRARSKKADEAAKQFAGIVKGEPVTKEDLISAFEATMNLQEHRNEQFLAYVSGLGITTEHLAMQPHENS